MRGIILFLALAFVCVRVSAQTDTAFWIGVPTATNEHATETSNFMYIRVTPTAATGSVNVTVSIPATGQILYNNVAVAAGSVGNFDISSYRSTLECQFASPAVANNGLKITATGPVTAYYDEASQFDPEIYALKGGNALGVKFYVPGQSIWSNASQYKKAYNTATIVATQDGTTVTVKPSVNCQGNGWVAGGTYTVTLNKGQTYCFAAATQSAAGHLGGTFITSDKPVAVTMSDDSVGATNNSGGTCLDMGGDQLVPTNMYGLQYISPVGTLAYHSGGPGTPPNPTPTMELAVMTALVDNTTITISQGGKPDTVVNLNAGKSFEYQYRDSAIFLNSNLPISLMHVTGNGCELGYAQVPPINCTGSSLVGVTRPNSQRFSLVVLVDKAGINSFTTKVNGTVKSIITPASFVAIPNTTWMYAKIFAITTTTIPSGASIITTNSAAKFHLGIICGDDQNGCSYGYFSDFSSYQPVLSSSAPVCSGKNFQLFCNPVNNAANQTFIWTGPSSFLSTDQNPLPNPASAAGILTYYCQVTQPGCSYPLKQIDVTVNPTPNVSSVSNMTFCNNSTTGDINFTSTIANTTFSWIQRNPSPGIGLSALTGTGKIPSFTAVNNGTTQVKDVIAVVPKTATCAGDTTNFILAVNPTPVITVQPVNAKACVNSTAIFTVTVNTPDVTYQWQTNNGTGSANSNFVNIPGATDDTLAFPNVLIGQNNYKYRVVVTSSTSSCPSTVSALATLTVNPLPTVKTNAPAAPCYPGTVNLKATSVILGSDGGLSYTYFMDAAATVPIPDATKVGAGTYYIVGTNTGTGCSSAPVPVTVTQKPLPVVNTNPGSYCKNGDFNLIASSVTAGSDANLKFSYFYDSLAQKAIPSGTATNIKAGTYYIVATSTTTTCTSKPTPVVVTEAPLPVVVTHTQKVCAPNTIDLTAAAVTAGSDPGLTFTYFLDNIQQYPIANPSNVSSGTYFIVGKNAMGCTSLATPDTAKVIALPTVVTHDFSVCYPATGNLTNASVTSGSDAGLKFSYYTDNAATTHVADSTKVTGATYYIVGTSKTTGCSADPKAITVTINPIPVVITNPQTICAPSKVNLTQPWVTTGSDAGLVFNYFTSAAGTTHVPDSTAVGTGTFYIQGRDPITTCISAIVPVTTKINPQPVVVTNMLTACTPNSIDITVPAATAGSDANLRFRYYTDTAMTNTVGAPNSVGTGTFYIVGVDTLTTCLSKATPIKTMVYNLPYVKTNNITVCAPTRANLDSAAVTAGSDPGLTYTYFIDASATTPVGDPTNVNSDVYYVVGKSVATGCVADPVAVSMKVNPQPTVVLHAQTACAPSKVNLTLPQVTTGSDAGLLYSYYTTSAATVHVPDSTSVNGPNIYYIVGQIPSTGCTSAPMPVSVKINNPPTIVITDPSVVCAPAPIDITAPSVTAGSDANVSYTYFSDAAGTKQLTNAQASQITQTNTYYIVGTSTITGCSTKPLPVNVTIKNQPTVDSIQGSKELCKGSSVQLIDPTSKSTSGTWSSSDNSIATITNTGLLTGVSAGGVDIVFSITGGNGCMGWSAPFHAVVDPNPNLVITNPTPVCSPGKVDLTQASITAGSDAGLTLDYYLNSATTSVLTNKTAVDSGTYYIKGTNPANKCYTVMPVLATINAKPKVAVQAPTIVCYPNKVNLETALVAAGSDAGLVYNYYSDAAATQPVTDKNNADAGTYYIVGTNTITGCNSDIKKVKATISPVPVVVTNTTAACSPNKVDLTGIDVTAGSDAGLTFTYFTDAAGTSAVGDPHHVGAGNFYIVGTSSIGCASAPILVKTKINPKPIVVTTNPSAVCSPGTVDLTALNITAGSTGGLSFTYYTDAAASSKITYTNAQAVPGGNYYIVGTDPATGCASDPAKVVATVLDKPKVQVANPPGICSPGTIDLNSAIVAAGSDPDLTFKFYSDAAATKPVAIPTSVDNGVYYVVGTSKTTSCTSDPMAITVTVFAQPNLVITNPPGVCTPGRVDIAQASVTAGSDAGLTLYYYSDAAGTIAVPDPHSVADGNYYIVGKSSSGCPTSPRLVVAKVNPIPNVVITDPVPVCSPDKVNLTAPAITNGSDLALSYTYFDNAAGTTPETTPNAVNSGVYYIVGTNPNTGCYSTPKKVNVVVNVKPAVQVTNPPAVCAPDKSDLSKAIVAAGTTPGLTYGYYIDAGGTKPVASPNAADSGTYYIIGTNPSTTCSSNPMQIQATVHAQPKVIVTNPAAACAPGKVDLTQGSVTALSDPGLSYTYFTDAGATTHLADSTKANAGTYYIVGTSSAGCNSVPAAVVADINPQPNVVVTNPAAVCSPNRVDLTAASITQGSDAALRYTYYTDAGATIVLNSPSSTPGGTYYIVGQNTVTGCKSDPKQVIVTVNDKPKVQVLGTLTTCEPGKINLNDAIVAAGSDAGLNYGFYIDAPGTKPVTDATKVDAGTYYIIGTNGTTSCASASMQVQAVINARPNVVASNPAPACSPNKVDLTALAVTVGSDPGLTYTYFTDAAATMPVTDATKADAGNYYIVGTATSSTGCSSVPKLITAQIFAPPALVVNNPSPVCSPDKIDLTAASITAGSETGLHFDYYTDSLLTQNVTDPFRADSGKYYIKATATTGCTAALPVVAVINAHPKIQVAAIPAVCAPAKVNLANAIVAAGTDAALNFNYYTDISGTSAVIDPANADAGTYYVIGTNPNTGCRTDAKQIIASIYAQPKLLITNPAAVCAPGMVDLTQNSITAGSDAGLVYTYYADAAAATQLPAGTETHVITGSYYIVGTASTGCPSVPKLVQAVVNPKPNVVVTVPDAVCSPNTVDLTSPAITAGSDNGLAFGYYTDAATTIKVTDATKVTAGTYYILAHNIATGCYADAKQVKVVINAKPLVHAANPPTVCAPAKGDLSLASTAGSDAGLSFKYYIDAAGTKEITAPYLVDAGTYYVIGTNTTTGCVSDAVAVEVNINAEPRLVITDPAPVCAPGTVDLTAPAITTGSDAGLLYKYYSESTGTTQLTSGDEKHVTTGTYYIQATASTTCKSPVKPVTVLVNKQPKLVVTDPAPVCTPNTVALTAPAITAGSDAGMTFKYYADAAATVLLSDPAHIAVSGTYYIVGTNNSTTCYVAPAPVKVTINGKPQVQATNPPTVCAPAKANLSQVSTAGSDAGLSFTFYIDAGATTPVSNISQVDAGTYYLVGTNTTTSCVSDPVAVTASINAQPKIVVTNPAAVCAPGTVNLTQPSVTAGSDAGLTYNYYVDATSSIHVADSTKVTAGTYYIQGTASTGCISVRMPVIASVTSKPVVVINQPQVACAPATVDLTAGAITAGSDPNLTYSYYTNVAQGIQPADPSKVTTGTYYIVGTAASGCYSDSMKVTVVVNPQPQVVVSNPPVVCAPGKVNLTLASTAGSDPNLAFTYYTDAAGASKVNNPASVDAGTYYIIGTDKTTGCVSEAKKIIASVNAQPKVVITNPKAVCAPGKVNLTQPGITAGSDAGLTFNYFTDASMTAHVADSTLVNAGTYYVVGIASTGCISAPVPVVASISPQPIVKVTNPGAVCAPATVDLKQNAITAGSDANLTYTYYMQDGVTLVTDATKVGAGTYYIVGATATGCSSVPMAVTVTVDGTPVIAVKNPPAVCEPGTVNLQDVSVTAGNDPSLTYKYYTADGVTPVSTPTSVSAGTYYIVGVATTGCPSAPQPLTATVNPKPVIKITNPQAVCAPNTVDLTQPSVVAGNNPGITYTYFTDAAGTVNLNGEQHVAAGTYYMRGTVTATSCVSDPVPVVASISAKPYLEVHNPAPVCAPGTADLTAAAVTANSDASLTFVYYAADGVTRLTDASKLGAGDYYIAGIAGSGCISDTLKVTVTVYGQPQPVFANPPAVCAPNKVNLKDPVVTAGNPAGFIYQYFYSDKQTSVADPASVDSGTYYIVATAATGCGSTMAKLTAVVHPKPVVQVTNPDPLCAPGTADLTLAGVTAGTASGISFNYYTNVAAGTHMADSTKAAAGTYYIVGTNAATGCVSDPVAVTVTVNDKPVVTVHDPAELCAPGKANLTAAAVTAGSTPANLTFTYYAADASTIISAADASQVGAGKYYIEGQSAKGCVSDKMPVNVVVNAKPVIDVNDPQAVCAPGKVNLLDAAVIAGNDPSFTYKYYAADGVTDITSTAGAVNAGQYYIVGISAKGCPSDKQLVTATVNAIPVLAITNPQAVCAPGTVDLTIPSVTAGNDPDLSYQYYTAADTLVHVSDATQVGAGTYYITGVSGKTGCVSAPAKVVATVNPKPVVVINNPAALCAPDKANLTAAAVTAGSTAGLTYTYYAADGVTKISTANASQVGAGTYYIIGVAGSGCADTGKVVVTINSKPAIAVANPPAVCAPGKVNLQDASVTTGNDPSFTYQYYASDSTTIITTPSAVDAGVYYIRATNGSTCVSNAMKLVATVNDKPVINPVNPQAVCAPGKVDLTQPAVSANDPAGLDYTYFTDAQATIPVTDATQVAAGKYYIVGTNAPGCSSVPTPVMVTVIAKPVVKITDPDAVCAPGKVNITVPGIVTGSDANLTYHYYDTDSVTVLTDATQLTTGTYYISGTNAAGCESYKMAVHVTVNGKPSIVVNDPPAVCAPGKVNLTDATVTAGNDPSLTYLYYGSDQTTTVGTPGAVSAGTYYISGKDLNGCISDLRKITATVHAKPVIKLNNPPAACAPALVDLTDVSVTAGNAAGLTYQYYSNASLTTVVSTPSQVAAGQYYVTATNGSSCISDAVRITATIYSKPNVVITDPVPACAPDKINLTAPAIVAGSDAQLTYTYYSPDGVTVIKAADATQVTAGTYYITGAAKTGCVSDKMPVHVTINNRPVVAVANPPAVCAPGKVNLTDPVVTAGNDPSLNYEYYMSDGQTPVLSPAAVNDGYYYVVGVLSSGCKSDLMQVKATVNAKPVISVTNPKAVCAFDKVDLTQPLVTAGNAAGLTYNYYVDAAMSAHVADSTHADAGKYYIVGITAEGCVSAPVPVRATVNNKPVVKITDPRPLCAPGKVSLKAPAITAGSDANLTYTYFAADSITTISDPTQVTTGTYYIMGTATTGCMSYKMPVHVTVSPQPQIAVANPPAVCAPGTVNLKDPIVTAGNDPSYTYEYYMSDGVTSVNTPGAVAAGTYYIVGVAATGCKSAPAPLTAVVNSKPVVVVTNPDGVCTPGVVNLTLPAVTSGSQGGLTYNYFTDAAAGTHVADSTAAGAGTYYIVGTTASGCVSDPAKVVVTVYNLPVVKTNNPVPVCEPGRIDLTNAAVTAGSDANLSFSYFAADGSTVLTTPGSVGAGTYYIAGKSSVTGCTSAPVAVTVTVSAKPDISVTNPPVVCAPGKVNLQDPSVTTGNAAGLTYHYFTSDGVTPVGNPSAVNAGVYFISATDGNSCVSDQHQLTAVINNKPVLKLNNPPAACAPGTVDLTQPVVTQGNDPALTYTYYTDVTGTHTIDSTKVPAGNYYLIGTLNASGCASDPTLVVATVHNKPVVKTTNPPAVCAPAKVNLKAPAVTTGSDANLLFTYYAADGVTVVNDPTMVDAGTYYIQGQDKTTGCPSDKQPVTVTINSLPQQFAVNNPPAVCAPGKVNLTDASVTAGNDPALIYDYYAADQVTVITTPAAVNAGTYYISAHVAGGCASAMKQVTATVLAKPVLLVTNPKPVCAPGTVDLTQLDVTAGSDAGLTFNYFTDATQTVHVADSTKVAAGTYYMLGIASTGCVSDLKAVTAAVTKQPQVVVTNPAPLCAPVKANITVPAVTAGSDANLTYTYFAADGVTQINNGDATQLAAGTYYIVGSNTSGCNSVPVPVTVTVNPKPQLTVTDPPMACDPGKVNLQDAAVTAGNDPSYTYNYYNADGVTTVTTPAAVGAGTYYVEAVAGSGCTSDKMPVTARINAKPTVVASNPQPLCTPATADITDPSLVQQSDAGLFYSYYADKDTTTKVADPAHVAASTYYIVGYTATGCRSVAQPVVVTVNQTPVLQVTANPAALCAPAKGNLTAAITNYDASARYLYYGSDGVTEVANAAQVEAGTYYIQVISNKGCKSAAMAQVTITINGQPQFVVRDPNMVCAPGKVDLTTSIDPSNNPAYTYEYRGDDGVTVITTPTAVNAGNYYVIAHDNTTTCGSVPQLVTARVNAKPNIVVTNPSPVCTPGTVNLTDAGVTAGSDAGLTFNYFTDATLVKHIDDSTKAVAGTYYIVGIASTGCQSAAKPVTATVYQKAVLAVTDPAPVCEPFKVNLTDPAITAGSAANLTFTYYQADGKTVVVHPDQVDAGDYYILGTATSGSCPSDMKKVTAVINPKPVIAIAVPGAVCAPGTVDLTALTAGNTGVAQFKYYTSDQQTEVIDPAKVVAGQYYIKGIAATGCESDLKPVTVTVNKKPYVQITDPKAICAPGTVNLQDLAITTGSDANLTYAYYTDTVTRTTVANPAAVGAGTYYAIGTSASTCESYAKAIHVVVNSLPLLKVTDPQPVCEPALVNLTQPAITAGSDVTNIRFNYFTDTLQLVHTTDSTKVTTGTYFIEAINTTTGCTSYFGAVHATVNKQPVVKVSATLPLCAPAKADLTVVASDPANADLIIKYFYADGTTTVTDPAHVDQGTYYVQGFAATSCPSVQQKVVITVNSKPSIQVQPTAVTCAPGTVDLTAAIITAGSDAGLTYTYYQADGTELQKPAQAGAGTYYIEGKSGSGCYSDKKQITVTVNPVPPLAVKDPAGVCAPQTVDLSSAIVGGPVAGITYLYYQADGTTTVTQPAQAGAGKYIIVASYATTGCTSAAMPVTVTVTAPPDVKPIAGKTPIWINNTATFTDATPNGVWSISSTDKTIVSINQAGLVTGTKVGGPATVQYTVTANGCAAAVTYNVTVIDQQIPPITDDNGNTGSGQLCLGGSIGLHNLYPNGGKWSSKDATIASVDAASGVVKALKPGKTDILFTTTNPAGAVTYTVTVNPLPHFTSAQVFAICTGSKAFASPMLTDISGTTYKWVRTDATGVTAIPAAASGSNTPADVLVNSTKQAVSVLYTFTLQAPAPTACANDTAKVTVKVYPHATVTVDAVQPVCQGTKLTLQGHSDVSGLQFEWLDQNGKVVSTSNPFVIDSATADNNQTYYFKVNTPDGTCSNQASVHPVVNAAPVAAINAGDPLNICQGQKLVIQATSNTEVTYSWTTPDNKTITGSSILIDSAAPGNSGNYILIAKPASGNAMACSSKYVYPVVVRPAPMIDIADKGPFCQSKTLDVIASTKLASGTTVFNWRTADAPEVVVVNGPELKLDNLQGDSIRYYSYAKNSNGCDVYKRISIPVGRVPKVEFPPIANICEYSDPFKLDATETSGLPGTGVFSGSGVTSNGMFNPSIAAGTYNITYTYTVQTGCADSKTQSFKVYPSPKVNAGDDQSIFEGFGAQLSATITGGYTSLKWTPYEDTASSHILNPVVYPKLTTLYTLKATNMYGCIAADDVTVTVMKFDLPNAFSPNGDGINDTWVIPGLSKYPNSLVEIFNRWGVLLFKSHGYPTPWDAKYNGQPVPSGTYYYLINLNDGISKKPLSGWLEIIR